MIRKHKNYSRPKKPYELARMKDENVLIERYGLKNKREIWKFINKVNYFRHRAMDLAKASNEEQEVLFNKLRALGLNVSSVADALALTVEDLLNRRLQTLVFKKGFASTVKQARQFVTHRKVTINGRVNNVPGCLIFVEDESAIKVQMPSTAEMKKLEAKKQ